MAGKDVVALIQTPKNIGGAHNQFLWYGSGTNQAGLPTVKTLRREDGNWATLVEEMKQWLTQYVPPHMLCSVSLFEDEHPNEGKGINAAITHCAGATPVDLSENEAAKGKDLYDMEVISGSGEWKDMFKEAQTLINKKGGQEGHMIASTNDSDNDGAVIIVLSWSSLLEGNLRESVRPASCMDNCTIF